MYNCESYLFTASRYNVYFSNIGTTINEFINKYDSLDSGDYKKINKISSIESYKIVENRIVS